jgi:hypothetical protein
MISAETTDFRRNWKWLLIVLPAVCLFLSWLFVVEKGHQEIAIKIESATLRDLQKAWQKEGKPESFDVSKYIASTGSAFQFDRNTYLWKGQKLRGLFSVRSQRFSRPGTLLLGEDGSLFWVDPDGTLASLDRRRNQK